MRTFFLACLLTLSLAATAQAKLLAADRIHEPQSLLPYCSWLLDAEGRQTIESITAGPPQERFVSLSDGIPLKSTGPAWIRLVIIKNPPAGPLTAPSLEKSRLTINLGQLPPGQTSIYFEDAPGPTGAPGSWHAETVAAYEDLLLPEPGLLPVNVYIRMEEMPGIWFAPTVSAKDAKRPDMLPPELLLPGLLIATAIVCLLRAIAERAQWAFWSALFLLSAVSQAVLPLPSPGKGLLFADLPALLAPGMGLILLPHIGRCMFRTDKSSHFQDVLLYLCSLLGLGLALVPLVPGFGWLARLFPLAPFFFAPLVPICLAALADKRPGCLAFTGATVMPLLGACAALYALKGPGVHILAVPLMAQGGLWGMVVGGIGLALARIPRSVSVEEKAAEQAGPSLAKSAAGEAKAAEKDLDREKAPAVTAQSQYEELPPLPVCSPQELGQATDGDTRPLEQPDAAAEALQEEQGPAPDASPLATGAVEAEQEPPSTPAPVSIAAAPAQEAGYSAAKPAVTQSGPDAKAEEPAPGPSFSPAPEAAKTPGDESAQASSPTLSGLPGTAAFSPALPDFASTSDSSLQDERARIISLVEEDFSSYPMALIEELRDEPSRYISLTPDGGFLFSLPSLVREVHDIVAPFAKTRGLIFSWYIAPSLPVLLEGDAPRLRGALSLLLQNAVLASSHGAVQLAVRQQPDGDGPGDLLFTISDNGSAQRTDAGFFHAWELAARTGGAFHVDYSPTRGTRISFSVRFTLPSEEAARAHLAHYPLPSDTLAEDASKPDEQASLLAAPFEGDDPVPVLHTVQAKPRPPVAVTEATPAEAAWLATVSPSLVFADQEAPPDVQPVQRQHSDLPPAAAEPVDQPLAEALDEFYTDSTSSSSGTEALFSASAAVSETLSEEHAPDDAFSSGSSLDLQRDERSDERAEHERPCIVAAEMTISKRRLLAHYLADVPHEQCNAANRDQVLELLKTRPVSLFIFDGDMPEPDITRTMAAIRREESVRHLGLTPILVLTSHDIQSARLLGAGATHALVKPFPQEAFLEKVQAAIPALGSIPSEALPDGGKEEGKEPEAEQPGAELATDPARSAEGPLSGQEHAAAPSLPESRREVSGAGAGPLSAPPEKEATPTDESVFTEEPERAPSALESLDDAATQGSPLFPFPPAPADMQEDLQTASFAGTKAVLDLPGSESKEPSPEQLPSQEQPVAPAQEMPAQEEQPLQEQRDSRSVAERLLPKRAINRPVMMQMYPRKDASAVEEDASATRLPAPEPPSGLQEQVSSSMEGPAHEAAPPAQEQQDTQHQASLSATKQNRDERRPTGKTVVVRLQSRDAALSGAPPEAPEVGGRSGVLPGFRVKEAPVVQGQGQQRTTPSPQGQKAPRARLTTQESMPGQAARSPLNKPVVVQVQSIKTAPPAEHAEASEEARLTEGLLPGDSDSRTAAPMIMGLSPEDVTPAGQRSGSTPEESLSRASVTEAVPGPAGQPLEQSPPAKTGGSGKGSLLDFVLADGEEEETAPPLEKTTAAPPGSRADETDAPSPTAPAAEQEIFVPRLEQSEETASDRPAPASPLYPLPGIEGEFLDVSMLPLAPGLIHALNDTLAATLEARDRGSTVLVQEASSRLAGKAEHFGLHKLGKIARCVERAASADDLEAVTTLLEDLEPITKRYMDAVQACFQSFLDIER